eukprot:gene37597-39123_t
MCNGKAVANAPLRGIEPLRWSRNAPEVPFPVINATIIMPTDRRMYIPLEYTPLYVGVPGLWKGVRCAHLCNWEHAHCVTHLAEQQYGKELASVLDPDGVQAAQVCDELGEWAHMVLLQQKALGESTPTMYE